MIRVEVLILILSLLPLIMALIFSFAVVPARKGNMQKLKDTSSRPAMLGTQIESHAEQAIQTGVDRALQSYGSLSSSRLLIPAAILSGLYWIGFTLGISAILDRSAACWMCGHFAGFSRKLLENPSAAVLGAYLFNMGVLIRRAYVADITKNVMWASLNRLILSCGFAIFFHLVIPLRNGGALQTTVVASFVVAFFPRLALTWLRRKATEAFGLNDDTCSELNIQLVQGIDIWKQERLEEEGIESIQNIATVDIFELIPKLHFPVRTIVDWMDQAIFIQRFGTCFQNDQGVPSRLRLLEQAGFRISAIAAAGMGRNADTPEGADLIQKMAAVISIDPAVLHASLLRIKCDAVIAILDRLWQTGAAED